ncbi:MAG: hypothetical protein HY579_04845 [Nitrospinae bacterium]|nr:hypothetical protein [Nitrospinota bacterium]
MNDLKKGPSRFSGKKIAFWTVCLCLLFLTVREAGAELQTLLLQHPDSETHRLVVLKGNDLSVKNGVGAPVYRVSLINMNAEKEVLGIAELPAGESFKLGFNKAGSYRLYYSSNPGNDEKLGKFVIIEVVPAYPA